LALLHDEGQQRGLAAQLMALVGAELGVLGVAADPQGADEQHHGQDDERRRQTRAHRSPPAVADGGQSDGLPSRRNPTPRTATTFSWTPTLSSFWRSRPI